MALGWKERESAKGQRHLDRQIKMGLTGKQYRSWLNADRKARKAAWAAQCEREISEFRAAALLRECTFPYCSCEERCPPIMRSPA